MSVSLSTVATSQIEFQNIVAQTSGTYVSRNQKHAASGCGSCNPCNTSGCGPCGPTNACCGDKKVAAIAAALFAGLILLGGSDNGSGSA